MHSEFDFIQNIKNKYGLAKIGDDCAVLPKDDKTDMVVTTDMLVEDIDFRLDWTTPEFLAHKSLVVSLSDVAAMAGTPVWVLLSIGIPESLWQSDFIGRFYEPWHNLSARFGVEIVGGDISKTPEKVVINTVVGGEVSRGKAVLRSGAKPGNAIYVTGELGGAAGGLQLLENGFRYGVGPERIWRKHLMRKQLKPWGQGRMDNLLRDVEFATAGIDISDGLSSDLEHLCRESGVGARIFAKRIPVNRWLRGLTKSETERLDFALNGGEDFELIFTVEENNFLPPPDSVFRHIGEVTANAGIIELIRDGKSEILEPKGYRHF